MASRRGFLVLSAFAGLALANRAVAQGQRNLVVGFLGPSSETAYAPWLQTMKAQLRELGYEEGKNLRTAWRFGGGSSERLPELARDLVAQKADVIVTSSTAAALAVKTVTTSTPVVTALIADPDETGVVRSLGRPGGNVTGLAYQLRELIGKRLELLKAALPQTKTVALVVNPANASVLRVVRHTDEIARSLAVALRLVEVRQVVDLEPQLAQAYAGRPDGAIFMDDPLFSGAARRIGELAWQYRVPTVGFDERVAEAGALFAYTIDQTEMYRRAAVYVDKIARGAKPADLPVERASRFLLMVNKKAAAHLRVAVPMTVLVRADRVIE